MRLFLKAMKYLAATLMALGVSRLALHLSVKLALSIDSGALFIVSTFLIAGAIYVFVITFRTTLSMIDRWMERAAMKRQQGQMENKP
jgi:hypothetical protein